MRWRYELGDIPADGRNVEAPIEAQARGFLLPRRTLLKVGVGLVVWPAAQFLQACATTGGTSTSRSRLRLISDEEEAKIGVAVFQQLQEKELKRGRLMTEPDGPAAHAWVKRVSDRVIWASGLGDKYRWEYILINAPGTANAIAFPGGRIIVFTGILPVARDDAGLATIIGHVVGHVMGHHMAERISKEFVMGFAEEIAREQGASDSTIATMRLVNRSILSQYSRIHETEADLIGLLLMSKAGYDPRESVKLWQRMNDAAGEFSRGHEFLHTHPGSGTQIADLQAWMQQALQYYENPSLALPVLK